MPQTFTTTLWNQINALANDKAFLIFVQITRPGGGFFRLVRDSRHQTADGHQWQAATVALETPDQSIDGDAGDLVVTVPNVARLPMAYLEAGELVGQTLTCWIAHEAALASFTQASVSWTSKVLSAAATEKTVRLVCGVPTTGLSVPKGVIDRQTFPSLDPGVIL